MSGFLKNISRQELAVYTVIGPLTCYAVDKISPTPHRNQLMALAAIDGCVFVILKAAVETVADFLTKKYGYVDEQGKVTNPKFYYLGIPCTNIINFMYPIFLRYVGQRMGYQVPNVVTTFAYLSFALNTSFATDHTIEFIKLSR